MNVCLTNAFYKHNNPSGGYAHQRQFVVNAVRMGHRVWIWHGEKHPVSEPIPSGRLRRFLTLRQMNVAYYRIEWKAPWCVQWAMQPRRWVMGNPLIVWEFNSVPEYALVINNPQAEVDRSIARLRHFGKGCDLAICVSNAIAEYATNKLGLKRVLTVPNGSDPDLFRPDAPPVSDIPHSPEQLNVAWIGSAELGWHNFELLRDAAWSVWNRGEGQRVAFHVIGRGFDHVKAQTPPNLHYHGPKPYEQLPSWLTAMDVGLCCYKPGAADYSSPLKVFDYMACGLTVVSTPQPQVKEVFERTGQPDLMVANDPAALADALIRLHGQRDRLRRQGATGRRAVVEYYNWRRAAKDTFDEIERIRAERGSAAMPQPSQETTAPARASFVPSPGGSSKG